MEWLFQGHGIIIAPVWIVLFNQEKTLKWPDFATSTPGDDSTFLEDWQPKTYERTCWTLAVVNRDVGLPIGLLPYAHSILTVVTAYWIIDYGAIERTETTKIRVARGHDISYYYCIHGLLLRRQSTFICSSINVYLFINQRERVYQSTFICSSICVIDKKNNYGLRILRPRSCGVLSSRTMMKAVQFVQSVVVKKHTMGDNSTSWGYEPTGTSEFYLSSCQHHNTRLRNVAQIVVAVIGKICAFNP